MPNISNNNNDKFSTPVILSSGEKTLNLNQPKVMGILNLTPDSFYEKSRQKNLDELLTNAEKQINEGASILDIGAVSTRPGAKEVTEKEELYRLLEALKRLRETFPEIWISIDTWRSGIAKICIEEGADMINDISGGSFDLNMPALIAEKNTPYVLMHIKGSPENMQKDPVYENIIEEVNVFFKKQISKLYAAGATQILLDPGFGFGKTLKHNYHLLKHLAQFSDLGYPILAGLSRKSMIYKHLNISPDEALNGTTVLHSLAIQNGARILRVHDVKETVQIIKLLEIYNAS